MSDLKEYVDLKKRVEQAQQNVDRSKGALEQLIKQLKVDFECPTLEDAEKKLKIWEKQKKDVGQEFNKKVKEFEEKYPEEG